MKIVKRGKVRIMNELLLKPGQAAKLLNVTTHTLANYAEKGILKPVTLPNGMRRYYKTEIYQLAGVEEQEEDKKKVFYIRSSDGDTTKLDTQVSLLEEKFGAPDKVYKDKASGLNEKRRGLQSLIKQVQLGNISTVYITQKDRLTRFGYSYLESMFNYHGVSIVVLHPKEEKALEKELLDDFMSLIASFSGKYYRLRGYENQKKLLSLAMSKIDKKKS